MRLSDGLRWQRTTGLVSRAVDSGFVVIDTRTQSAHALEADVAEAWRWLGDGATPAIADQAREDALRALAGLGLIEVVGTSRRSVLARGAVVAVGAGIASIALPMASAAASTQRDYTFSSGSGVVTIPSGCRNITITIVGASGGDVGATTGNEGGGNGGKVVWSPTGTLTASLVLHYDLGTQGSGTAPGTCGTTYGADISGGAGGAGYGTGAPGAGGGAGSRVVVFGMGTLIAGGGGGEGVTGYPKNVGGDVSPNGFGGNGGGGPVVAPGGLANGTLGVGGVGGSGGSGNQPGGGGGGGGAAPGTGAPANLGGGGAGACAWQPFTSTSGLTTTLPAGLKSLTNIHNFGDGYLLVSYLQP